MPTRGGNPRITIQADAAPVERAVAESERSLGRLQSSAHKAGEGLKVGVAAGAVAATAGLGAFVDQVKESADAARESEISQSKLEAQLKALGISYKAHAKQIDEVIQKTSRLSGLDDEDLQDAFTNVVRATGNVNGALKDMSVVADLARAKHLDVAKAGDLVAKVHNGNVGVLKRYGVAIDPVTKAQDALKASTKKATDEQVRAAKEQDKQATAQKALAELTNRFSGQAKKYGDTTQGSLDKAGVAWENLHEAIGSKVTPVLAKAALGFVGLLDKAQAAGPAVSKFAGQVRSAVQAAIPTAAAVFQKLKTAITGVISTITGLARGFQQSKGSAVAIVAVIGGLAAGLATAALVIKTVTLVTKAWAIAQAALNLVLNANPIGLAIVAIAGLAAGLTIAYKKSATFRDIVNGAFGAIKSVTETVFPIIKKMMQYGLLGPIGLIITHFGTFKRIAGDAFSAVKSAAGDVADAINRVKDAISGVVGTVGKVGSKVAGFFGVGDGIGRLAAGGQLPSGGAFGGSLMGARPSLRPFAAIGSRFGLHVSDGKRPAGTRTVSGGVSYHSTGEAIDMADGRGPDANKLSFFNYLKSNFGGQLAELIYTPGGLGIKDGRPYRYTGAVAAEHYDHVHVAFDTGTPGVGDGIGDIKRRWVKDGGDPSAQDIAGAIAMAESGGNATITHRNSDGSIDRGLFQINSTHGALSTIDRDGNTRAAISISSNGRNWRPWTTYTSGAYKRFLTSIGRAPSKAGSSPQSTFSAASGTANVTGNPYVASGTGSLVGGGQTAQGPSGGTGPAASRRTYTGAIDAIGFELAESEGDKQKTARLLFEEAVLKRRRLDAIKTALKGHLRPATRSRLLGEATQLVGDLNDISAAMYDLTDGKAGRNADGIIGGTPAAAAERAAAMGTASDSSGGSGSSDTGGGDPNQALIDATNALAEIERQKLDLDTQIADNQNKILALANQGPAILGAVIAAVNGGIGGQLGLGFQTPGYAGGVASYGGSAGRL